MDVKDFEIKTYKELGLSDRNSGLPNDGKILVILQKFLGMNFDVECSSNVEMWVEIYKKAFTDGVEHQKS